MSKQPLIVDEYQNHGGKLRVALRTSLVRAPEYVLTREEATALRDELNRALAENDEVPA